LGAASRCGTEYRHQPNATIGAGKVSTNTCCGRGWSTVANGLADASSPYLRQHADNPVDRYEWGDEAFEEARRRDVPIFLSVGYSSCHW
jgi:hypothetical protein